MTNKELAEMLSQYPPEMEVKVSCGNRIWPAQSVSPIVELGANTVSINIRANESEYADWKMR